MCVFSLSKANAIKIIDRKTKNHTKNQIEIFFTFANAKLLHCNIPLYSTATYDECTHAYMPATHTHTHTVKQISVIGLHATESDSKNVNLYKEKRKFLSFTENCDKLIKFEN